MLNFFAQFVEAVLDALWEYGEVLPEHVSQIEFAPWDERSWWVVAGGWAFNMDWQQVQGFRVLFAISDEDGYEWARSYYKDWPTWEDLQDPAKFLVC